MSSHHGSSSWSRTSRNDYLRAHLGLPALSTIKYGSHGNRLMRQLKELFLIWKAMGDSNEVIALHACCSICTVQRVFKVFHEFGLPIDPMKLKADRPHTLTRNQLLFLKANLAANPVLRCICSGVQVRKGNKVIIETVQTGEMFKGKAAISMNVSKRRWAGASLTLRDRLFHTYEHYVSIASVWWALMLMGIRCKGLSKRATQRDDHVSMWWRATIADLSHHCIITTDEAGFANAELRLKKFFRVSMILALNCEGIMAYWLLEGGVSREDVVRIATLVFFQWHLEQETAYQAGPDSLSFLVWTSSANSSLRSFFLSRTSNNPLAISSQVASDPLACGLERPKKQRGMEGQAQYNISGEYNHLLVDELLVIALMTVLWIWWYLAKWSALPTVTSLKH
ncbi:hypothetical protein BT69DRAFT_1302263 [Atractiella rhizophila]|nr:hypothetical protein BT69DRAFT_1302263 [Atractiella rhizophila]